MCALNHKMETMDKMHDNFVWVCTGIVQIECVECQLVSIIDADWLMCASFGVSCSCEFCEKN